MSPSIAASIREAFPGRFSVRLPELARAMGRTVRYLEYERQRGRLRVTGTGKQRSVLIADLGAYGELLDREGNPAREVRHREVTESTNRTRGARAEESRRTSFPLPGEAPTGSFEGRG